ncbi:hypothetical protein GDO78_016049, partial [Eleutherodactylus coqui]
IADTGSTQPAAHENSSKFIYPQMDLLEVKAAVNTPFPFGGQNHVSGLPPRVLYENTPYPSPFPPAMQAAAPFYPGVPVSTPFFPSAQHPFPPLPTVPMSASPVCTNTPLFPEVPTLSPIAAPFLKATTNIPSEKGS